MFGQDQKGEVPQMVKIVYIHTLKCIQEVRKMFLFAITPSNT